MILNCFSIQLFEVFVYIIGTVTDIMTRALFYSWRCFQIWFWVPVYSSIQWTSRDRPKSAPYPRLKNSKKTFKCQVFFYSTRKSKILRKKFFRKNYILKKMDRVARRGPLARAPGALKGGHFRNCQHFCRSWRGFVAKHQKIEGGKFLFSEKISVRKKTERGDPLGFSNIHCVAKQQKNWRGDPLGKKFPEKKSRSAEKNWKAGGTLRSRRVWYVTRKNRKNLFGSVR